MQLIHMSVYATFSSLPHTNHELILSVASRSAVPLKLKGIIHLALLVVQFNLCCFPSW